MPIDDDAADRQAENFNLNAALLQAVGLAEAAGEQLDLDELSRQLDLSSGDLRSELNMLQRQGLIRAGVAKGQEAPPMLLRSGRQYLRRRGDVEVAVLNFLPETIDDLDARSALIHAGSALVDEFRYAVRNGVAVEHAAELVPPAFTEAVTEVIALDLYAAAIALMVRLSENSPAGCVAEEIIAVRLIDEAAAWLDMRADAGELSKEDAKAAQRVLPDLFEPFQDDDVLDMFEMAEPADAAVAGHTPVNVHLGVVDQRIEAWFQPFDWTTPTGYLHDGEHRPMPFDD